MRPVHPTAPGSNIEDQDVTPLRIPPLALIENSAQPIPEVAVWETRQALQHRVGVPEFDIPLQRPA